jgi:TP901 family phage tail tape measure protein
VANTLEIVIKGTDRASATFDKVAGKASGFGAGLQSALRGAVVAGGLVAGAIAGIGVAAARAFGPTIELAREFELAVVDMGIAADGTGLSLATLEEAAIAVGGDTSLLGVTASDAAEAITGLFKAGLTSTEVFADLQGYMAGTAELGGALRASIDLAAATELDMVQASDLAAVALSTFGGELETEEERARFVEDAMNNLVQAANASVSSVSDLAASMATAGPVFAMFGFDLEDTNNALAILSMRGIKGAEAGTALKSMLMNMTAQTDSTQEAWASLGLGMYDADGAMRELPDVIGDLNGAMADMTEEERNATMAALAGSYGIKALSTLLAEGEQGWRDMAQATADAMGITEQARLKVDTLAGAQEVLEGVMETLKIQIGQALLPALTTLAQTFAGLAEQYGPQVVAAMGAIGAWLGDNLPGVIAGAIAWFENLVASLTPVVAWIVAFVTEHGPMLQEAFIAIAAVLGAFLAAGSLAAIAMAIAAMANPISLIAAGIALLAVAWTRDWGGIRTALTKFWTETGQPIFETVKAWLEVKIPEAITVLKAFWEEKLLPALQAVWAFIEDRVFPTFAVVWQWLQEKIPAAVATAAQFWNETLKPALEAVWAFLQDNVFPIFTTLWNWLQTSIPEATAETSSFWTDTLKPALEAVWGFIEEYIIPIFTALVEVHMAAVNLAVTALTGLWQNVLLPALTDAWEFIRDNLGPILSDLADGWLTGVKAAAETLSTFWSDTLQPALEAAWAFIKDNLGPILVWFKDDVVEKLTGALDSLKGALTWVRDRLNDLKNALKNLTLPDWLTPGSPTPLELGLRGINAALADMPRSISVVPQAATMAGGMALAAGPATHIVHNYNLSANYAYQDERTLTQDVRLLSMLGA